MFLVPDALPLAAGAGDLGKMRHDRDPIAQGTRSHLDERGAVNSVAVGAVSPRRWARQFSPCRSAPRSDEAAAAHTRTMTRSSARLLALALVLTAATPSVVAATGAIGDDGSALPVAAWTMPLPGAAVARGFEAPAHAYAAGHRGVDLVAGEGDVVAPSAGVIAFAGPVAGRPVLTIDHGGGLVTSLEPVATALRPGTPVGSGQPVGTAAPGGHAGDGSIHFGVRRNGEYINPLLLVAELERPVLLPCC